VYPARREQDPECDAWLALAVAGDGEWRRLCDVLEAPGLAHDERFATHAARRRNEDALDAIVAAWSASRDKWEAAERLQRAGIAAAAVEHLKDMMETDPQLRDHYQQLHQPAAPDLDIPVDREAAQWVGRTLQLRRSPSLGEHNHYVLQEILGVSDERFAQLVADDVVV
jgi:crotonobetainyl-CoA:carnitine CoA-transferase CaiB-like acyl-CoA transferase